MPLRSWNWRKRSAENKCARELLDRFLHPPKRIICTVPLASFAALIFIFASHREESAAAYPIFLLSAYSLVILPAALPALAGRLAQLKLRFWERSRLVRKISSTAFGYRRRKSKGASYELRCYRRTTGMLFILNIPMGGMIVLMVQTNSGFSYPGYLSAAQILNFVSAMMSVLDLQTAMITRFSNHGEGYRKMMNAITGAAYFSSLW